MKLCTVYQQHVCHAGATPRDPVSTLAGGAELGVQGDGEPGHFSGHDVERLGRSAQLGGQLDDEQAGLPTSPGMFNGRQ